MNENTINNTIDHRCKACFLKTYRRLFGKFNVSIETQNNFLSYFDEVIAKYHNGLDIQRHLHHKFYELVGTFDPFVEEKENSNLVGLQLYEKYQPQVLNAENPFDMALRLAIAGNIMDYAASNSFDIQETINKVLRTTFAIDDSQLLYQKTKKAKKILYLGDNAGEIVFDKLFIETLDPNKVIFAVRNAPILNDVTLKDAEKVGLEKVAQVVSNGFNGPSTVLSQCSKEFLNIYASADLILSKGQGNFEGLMEENDTRLFFLLMTKCDVIAEKLNVEKGSFIVYNKK